MSEISTPVTAVKVSYKCDECGVGEMKMSGTMLPSLPPQYGHSCGSLPDRQLRKKGAFFMSQPKGSLPDRQLRNSASQ